MVVFLSYQSKISKRTCAVYMTGEYGTMFLKSNNLKIFTKLFTAETFNVYLIHGHHPQNQGYEIAQFKFFLVLKRK